MTVATLCGQPHRRPNGEVLACQYLPRHPANRHSWWAAMVTDQASNHATVVQEIAEGLLDPYLEAILTAAHTRKHALRGVIF